MNLLEKTCHKIFPQDSRTRIDAALRLNHGALPHCPLGDLSDLAVELAGMTGSVKPQFTRKAIVTMAGDHGLPLEGISNSQPGGTARRVHTFLNGGTVLKALAEQAGADVFVVDMGVDADLDDLVAAGKIIDKKVGSGTNNIFRGPAMSIARARQAVEAGIDVAMSLCKDYDLLGTGGMGIGNEISCAAIAAVTAGRSIEQLTGSGAGIDDVWPAGSISTIKKILEVNKPDKNNGLDVLSKVGGFEIGGIAGLIIGAATCRVPVVVDGVISAAGALVAYRIEPFIMDYLVFAHRPVDPGHGFMQKVLGCKKPLLDLNMRPGDGTGAAVAMNLVAAAAAVLSAAGAPDEPAVAGATAYNI